MTTIDLIYFNAGGGHRAAAAALQTALQRQHPDWQVRCVNLIDMIDPRSRFRRITGKAPEDLYNLRLARGWTLGMPLELGLLQAAIRLGHSALVRRLETHWQAHRSDLVVSLIPNFNRAIDASITRAMPGVPFVTVMTDIADHPPHFWIEPDAAQYVVCGSGKAVQQALAMGVGDSRIHASSGMILRPDFYQPQTTDRRGDRERLGLDPDRATAVVMFGGQGCEAMATIERELDDVQLVLMCGHNQRLAERLRERRASAPRAVLDFTPEVRRHLRLGDFFIGKPGPGSLSEAVHLGLPVLTIRNAWTMPQERYNTDWVREHRLGVVVASWRDVAEAARDLLAQLPELRSHVQQIDNLAVFELPHILEHILHAGAARSRDDAEWAVTRPSLHDLASAWQHPSAVHAGR
jgi:UDP-N-acetylglucosamine:LPS N-acetylglucosamine transferase